MNISRVSALATLLVASTGLALAQQVTAAFTAMQALCVETLPGDYELVAHVHVRDQQAEVSSQ